MVQWLLIIGSSIFVLLGIIHAVFTFQDLGDNPRNFTPDAELRRAMQQSAVALDPKINLWRAWLGFHFSHSLGLAVFGGAFLYVGFFHLSQFAQSPLLQVGCILVSAAYVLISLKFWFLEPAIFTAIPTGCFISAAALSYL